MNQNTESNKFDVDEIIQQDKDFLWHHILPHKVYDKMEPMIFVEGNGLIIKDIRGREYLDASSGGVWTVNVGYGRESIAKVVASQLTKLNFFAGRFGNIPTIKLSEKLISLMPGLSKVYFSNSGSEANEKAFKLIRQMASLKNNKKRKIIYRYRDYHGTTIAALSATGQPNRKKQYGPMLEGFVEFPHACCYRCHFDKSYPDCNIDCARALEDVIKREDPDTIGAVIVEPITAGGGIIPPVKEYYPILEEICKKYEIYTIFDEVVCGFGRTGTMFGYEHYNVKPDIVTMAKGMASAYVPISATATSQEIYDIFLNDPADSMGFFRDISTYGGCAGGTAAALENISIIESEKLCKNSKRMGEYLMDCLQDFRSIPIVGDVRGKGLLVGIEIVKDQTTKEPLSAQQFGKIIADITGQGVLVSSTTSSFEKLNNTIGISPALTVNKDQIDRIVAAIRTALEKNVL